MFLVAAPASFILQNFLSIIGTFDSQASSSTLVEFCALIVFLAAMSTSIAQKPIPQSAWDLHRDTITSLYIVDNRKLKGREGVIEIMRTCHGFSAR